MGESCQTCRGEATQYDYDQRAYFCDRHVQQADFTVPVDGRPRAAIETIAARELREAFTFANILVQERNPTPYRLRVGPDERLDVHALEALLQDAGCRGTGPR